MMKLTSLTLTVSLLAGAAAAASKPNVLFILADDMGFSDAGCYGGEIATPNLDRLAKDGLRFTQFYNTARCWPSRGALMTGYYAQQVRRDAMPGVPGGGHGIRPAWAPLLSDMLKPLGYRTYHSGKWHIDGEPLKNGFERSYQIEGAQNNHFKASGISEDGVQLADTNGFYATIGAADHAVRCLKEHAEKHAGEPFFEYLAFICPHFPLHALAEDIARYHGRYTAGWDALREERWARMKQMGIVGGALACIQRDVGPPYDFPDMLVKLGAGEVNRPLPWGDLTPEQQAFQAAKMSIHAAMIDRMDREIGHVLDQVRAMGAWDNTLILFASDNGASAEIMVRGGGHDPKAPPGSEATFLCLGPGFSGAANTPLRRHKTWVHEGGISTPLIAHWPAGIAARGELRATPAHLVDIVPTVLEVAGGTPPAEWGGKPAPARPGRSLVPAFKGDGAPLHDELWWCHDGHRALRAGDWKIVSLKNAEWELFNLAKDRAETTNLAGKHPERVREMAARWEALAAEYRAQALQDAPPPAQPKKAKGKKPAAK